MPAITLIIFDMDGVLCHYDFKKRLALLADITVREAREIDETIFKSGFDDEGDQGHYSAEDYLRLFGEHLGVPVFRDDWLRARRQSIEPDPVMLSLVKAMARRVSVAMLTNNGPLLQEGFGEVFPEAAAIFGDRAFFSSQLKSTKEVPEIFHRVLDALEGRPETTLFIDDSETYIAAAQAAGMHTHHFKGTDGLKVTLRELGLSPDDS